MARVMISQRGVRQETYIYIYNTVAERPGLGGGGGATGFRSRDRPFITFVSYSD